VVFEVKGDYALATEIGGFIMQSLVVI